MPKPEPFADILACFIEETGYSYGQLSKRSSLPKTTIQNWVSGHVNKPHRWQDIAKLGKALNLDDIKMNQLLECAQHSSLELLLRVNSENDRKLLSSWEVSLRRRAESAPFQAIRPPSYFVGRTKEIRSLKRILLSSQDTMIYSLEGLAGVGKTALAAQMATELRPHFPDGVLWARLDASEPMSILNTFATAFGGDVSKYPDLDSRSRVFREMIANKRTLIVLDNALTSEEIRPLLPPTGPCVVLITTRRRDLAITRGGVKLEVPIFNPRKKEALMLFRRVLGEVRVRKEKSAFMEIADLLGHLPLAIAIIASRLAWEPRWSTDELLKRLRKEKQRIEQLVNEDESVRLSFNLSYDSLEVTDQKFFADLGVFGGQDFSRDAAAIVGQVSLEDAQERLRKLYGLSLVQEERPGRYRLHPLLHDYVNEKRDRAGTDLRMVQFFVDYAQTNQKDYAKLNIEFENIKIALRLALDLGMKEGFLQGVNALGHFLDVRGLYELAGFFLKHAEEAAQSLEDARALTTVMLHCGRIARKRGDYLQANRYFEKGLALARELDDQESICDLLNGLGGVVANQGHYVQAEEYFREGFSIASNLADRERIALLLDNLGVVTLRNGEFKKAEKHFLDALAIAREIKDQQKITHLLLNLTNAAELLRDGDKAEAYTLEGLSIARKIGNLEQVILHLVSLGRFVSRRGNFSKSRSHLLDALETASKIGYREGIIESLDALGELSTDQKNFEFAQKYFERALKEARELEHFSISIILCHFGELQLIQRKLDGAYASFLEAVQIGRRTNHTEFTAIALFGLARVANDQGKKDEACAFARESFDIFSKIGHSQAEIVKKWLESHA